MTPTPSAPTEAPEPQMTEGKEPPFTRFVDAPWKPVEGFEKPLSKEKIREWEQALADCNDLWSPHEVRRLFATIEALQSDRDRLAEALRPFSMPNAISDLGDDTYLELTFNVGDLRRASTALTGKG